MQYAARPMASSAREVARASYPGWAYVAIPMAGLLIQIYLPLFNGLEFVERIDLPLLAALYFALMTRSQLGGLGIGLAVGLTQDSFFHQPIGMFGICKTLAGFFAASVGMRFDVEHSLVRMTICFGFYVFHQTLYWVIERSLLSQQATINPQAVIILGLVNAIIGVAVFHFLDKLRARR